MGVFDWLRRELTPQQNYPTQYGQRPSGIVVPQLSRPLQNGQSALGAAASAPTYFGAHNGPNVGSDGWFMPKYNGRHICDWGSDISALKRSGDLSRALVIARGCMDAMIAAARLNPVNVAEYYVTQVAIIQHKQKDYSSEVDRALVDAGAAGSARRFSTGATQAPGEGTRDARKAAWRRPESIQRPVEALCGARESGKGCTEGLGSHVSDWPVRCVAGCFIRAPQVSPAF